MVQWLRLQASTAEGMGLIPGLWSSACHVVWPKRKKKKEKKKKKESKSKSCVKLRAWEKRGEEGIVCMTFSILSLLDSELIFLTYSLQWSGCFIPCSKRLEKSFPSVPLLLLRSTTTKLHVLGNSFIVSFYLYIVSTALPAKDFWVPWRIMLVFIFCSSFRTSSKC